MAGDWIKVQHVTPDKPEVIGIADHLGIDQDAVTGKLLRLWIWADQQTFDGNAGGNGISVTTSFIDRCTSVAGFADAMIRVGWLSSSDGRMTFPNFDRHNGQTAKQRGLTTKRVARHRDKSNDVCNDGSVTQALPEKRREEKTVGDKSPTTPIAKEKKTRQVFQPPTIEEVTAYCNERGNGVPPEQFVAFYSGKGWKIGSSKMVDWKAAVITWEPKHPPKRSRCMTPEEIANWNPHDGGMALLGEKL